MTVLDRYFANPAALPAMPEIAQRLLREMERPDIGLQELSSVISRDQSLSMKMLRLANSSRYSPSRTISTLNDAAAFIGQSALRDLALAACVSGAFPNAVAGFDRLRFWRQCMATAGHARTLAQGCALDTDTAYLGGLVLRTGELLMWMAEPEKLAEAQKRAQLPDSLLESQRAVVDCSYPEVTAELARRWRFPEKLIEGLATAADPLSAKPFSRLGAVLRLASVMSDAGDRGLPALATTLSTQPELVERLKLDLEWLADHLAPWEALVSGVDQLLH